MDHRVWEEDDCALRVDVGSADFDAATSIAIVLSYAANGREAARIPAHFRRVPSRPSHVVGTWSAPPRVPRDGDPWVRFGVHVEVDGRRYPSTDTVRVYARTIAIVARWAGGHGPSPGARVRLTQRAGPDVRREDGVYVRDAIADGDGRATVPLKYPWGDIEVSWLRPFVGEPLTDASATMEGELTYAPRMAIFWPPGPLHRQWINLPEDPVHPDRGRRVSVRIGALDPTEIGGVHPIFIAADFVRGDVRRGGRAQAQIDPAAHEAVVPIALGGAAGEVVELSAGGIPSHDDAKVKLQAWRRLDVEILAPDGLDLPETVRARIDQVLAPAFVKLEVVRVQRDTPERPRVIDTRVLELPDDATARVPGALLVRLCDACVADPVAVVHEQRIEESPARIDVSLHGVSPASVSALAPAGASATIAGARHVEVAVPEGTPLPCTVRVALELARASLRVAGSGDRRIWAVSEDQADDVVRAIVRDLARTFGVAEHGGADTCIMHYSPGRDAVALCDACIAHLAAHPMERPWT